MEVRRLEYFICIADVGSLGRASDVLRIAQPALTRQVRLLEQELGVQLFTRTRRGMRLTSDGEDFLAEIGGPIRQLRGALQRARGSSGGLTGNVALGLPQTVASLVGRAVLERATSQEPNISLRIVEGTSQRLVEWLTTGELDAVILYGSSEDEKFVTRHLLTEEMVLVGPPGSELSADRPVDQDYVASVPLILSNTTKDNVRRASKRPAAKPQAELNIRYIIDSLTLQKDLVGAGLGYTILPRAAVQKEIEQGQLTYALIEDASTRSLVLATRPHPRSPRIFTRIEQIIVESIADLREKHDI